MPYTKQPDKQANTQGEQTGRRINRWTHPMAVDAGVVLISMKWKEKVKILIWHINV